MKTRQTRGDLDFTKSHRRISTFSPSRVKYYRRIFSAYLTSSNSQLTFWHETPAENERFHFGELGEYYMPFASKADFPGPFDDAGIPMLDYRGALGRQYNPIAIAQYGLGNYNLFSKTGDTERKSRFLRIADWLVQNLEQNPAGLRVWNHHFDWEYRTTLQAPWYSALAQGQGISLLVRAHRVTGNPAYLEAARDAFQSLLHNVDEGGVAYVDEQGRRWLEEYIVSPPTHILNGFIWASWGVYDFFLATGDLAAKCLFENSMETLEANLHLYDAGFWSLYEQSGTRLKMMASPFYHALHVVQLQVLYRLTGRRLFQQFAERWNNYRLSYWKRTAALIYKAVFKLCYY